LTGRAATSPWWEKVKTSRRREVVICLQTKPASAAAQRRTRLVIAARGREGCSVRKVNMTISLAFLAPDLVKAAIDGRLPPWPASAISRPNGLASARCLETLKTHSIIVNYARGAVSVV
jgi:hypothetical protein